MIELSTLIEWFEDSLTSSEQARRKAERDRDYVDHKQLTAEELSTLAARKQPPVMINRIKPKIDFLRGLERQGRTDPKAYPRTPQHQQDAESATDALRYVADNVVYDQTKSAGFDTLLVEGVEGVEIVWDGENIGINHLHWDRIFYDQHSRNVDFSDAKYKGIVVWMDLDDALTMYPGKKELIEGAMSNSANTSETYEDKPTLWTDTNRKRLRVVQIYYLDGGEWTLAHYTKSGFLVDPMPSPYIDDMGRPECAIELQSAYVDRDNNRYGIVRALIDIQDEINKRRSKALHLLSQRQTFSNERAIGKDGIRRLKAELAKPDGHIQMNAGAEYGKDFGTLNTNDLAMGQFQLLQEAKGEIDAIGANSALTGKEDANQSGRAILARQSGGQLELTPIFDSHRAIQTRTYRQVRNRIRQFWTGERWVRVTDDDRNMKWVGFNKPVTVGENLSQQFGGIPPEFQNDPRLNTVVGVDNPVSELDVDIILEDAPDTVTIQQEQFDALVQMYQANPNGIPWDMVVEASQLRNKEQLLSQVNGDPEQRAQQQAQQEAMQQAAVQVDLENTQADSQNKLASAQKAEADAFKSAMDGMIKQQELMNPPPLVGTATG